MNVNDICAYTAAYIFMHDDEQLNDHETLVKSTSSVVGDRMSLKSLMFRCLVDQKIINLVVARKNWLIEIKVCLVFAYRVCGDFDLSYFF
ncbi:hypothetical protein QL285_091507 [Trifolium repens]|nr:hypothetical protein QL285_091507 [Trifolium repens]